MSELDVPDQSVDLWIESVPKRQWLILATVLLGAAALCGLAASCIDEWSRYAFVMFGIVLGSWGFNFLLLLLPRTHFREVLRGIILAPPVVILFLLRVVQAYLTPIYIVGGMFVMLLAAAAVVARSFAPVDQIFLALVYVCLLVTIVVSAYAGNRILLPVRWFLRLQGRDTDRRTVEDAQAALRVLNLRRLAYQITILAYTASVCVDLTGITLAGELQAALDVSAAALLGFVSVDAYVATFHPRLIRERAPLRFEKEPARSRVSTSTT